MCCPMPRVTLEQLHEDLVSVKEEISRLRALVQEDFELADDAKADIKASRKRPSTAMVSHDEMRREFG